MNLDGIILKARDMGCSDVHISAGEPVFFRQNGTLVEAPYDFKAREVEAMIEEVLDKRQLAAFDDGDDLDFALVSSDGLRQRVNVFRQRGHIAATCSTTIFPPSNSSACRPRSTSSPTASAASSW